MDNLFSFDFSLTKLGIIKLKTHVSAKGNKKIRYQTVYLID